MTNVNINLNAIDKVKKFVHIMAACEGDFDLSSGRYVVDAKSIMGIFSLDLGKTLTLGIHDDSNVDDICGKLEEFMV